MKKTQTHQRFLLGSSLHVLSVIQPTEDRR